MITGYITPGLSQVFWVPTLTSTTTPSAAEINAGTEITAALQGMPDAPRSGNIADDSDLSSRVDKQQRGTITLGEVTLRLKRTASTETQYLAVVEDAAGHLAVFRKGTASGTAAGSADVCDVFSVEVNTKGPGTPGRNEVDFSMVTLINTDVPAYDSVCTA
jgi:hypothetical protein